MDAGRPNCSRPGITHVFKESMANEFLQVYVFVVVEFAGCSHRTEVRTYPQDFYAKG